MKRFKARQIFLSFILILSGFLITGCGGGGDTGHWLPANVVSVAVTPATATVPLTGTQQFTATATYVDGSSRDVTASSTWVSGTPVNASVGASTGLATGNVVGTSTSITATFGGKSGSGTLTVNPATSMGLTVTPTTASIPVTGTQKYTAIEIFSDGTSIDRTTNASTTWTSSSAANATLSASGVAGAGLATGIASRVAPVVITATFGVGGPSATANLTVTAATSKGLTVTPATASVPVTGTQQYTAIEIFSDGTSIDRTTNASTAWTSSSVANATLSPSGVAGAGLATGVASRVAPVVITATFGVGGPSATANLTVTAATSTSFKVVPATASITVAGGTQQFNAIETFSDGSTINRTTDAATAWTSVNLPLGGAVVSTIGLNTGIATGNAMGQSTITATYGIQVATAILTVSAPDPGVAGLGPDLKTVAPYGIMAWDAITINAASHIYGDVALPGGVIASVIGPNTKDGGVAPHLTASAVTNRAGVTPREINTTDNGILTPAELTQLQTDLKAVYDDLMARAAPVTALTTIANTAGKSGGTFPAAAPDLSGYVLSPGVFTTAGTYGLSNTLGPLVLDAGGNPDAVFIIRSTGLGISGFTSTTGSVLLQNGTQSKNVFWVVDNLTVGGGTFFQGTVVAGHVITLNTFANVQGRMLAGALSAASGAITLSGTNIITVPQ